MRNKNILFDDWQVRSEGAFDRRKREYAICLIPICIMLGASIVGIFYEWAFFAMTILAFIALVYVWLEWLKVKNNHLVIKSNQIEITNRFNKTVVYETNIEILVLAIKQPMKRGAGMVMKFYDSQNNLICTYEDMLNHASLLGEKKTTWEKEMEALGIKIIDAQQIIKNK